MRARVALLLAAVALIVTCALRKPVRTGDGYEYFSMLQAWFDHGSPDLRAEDTSRLASLLAKSGIPVADDPYAGFFESSRNHRNYSWHFFAYPLVAVPAKAVLHLVGGNELCAFQVTNAALLALALYVLVFRCRTAPLRKRLTIAGLATLSPVLWYVPWTHPEVFTWAMVLLAIAFLDDGRPALAVLFTAFGALQNPPLAILSVALAVASFRRAHSFRTLAATAPCFAAPLFYGILYGQSSLVAREGFAAASLLSWGRTVSFFCDLNQGMLPYVPALVIGASIAGGWAIAQRRAALLGMLAVTLAMVLACEVTPNWNMGAAGLIRYAVWMLPIFAWLVSELPAHPRLLAAAMGLHAVIAATGSSREGYLEQRPIAAFVLTHAPSLYDPEVEVFAERQLAWEDDPGRIDWRAGLAHDLPMPYVDAHGRVTKLLVDSEDVGKMAACLDVAPSYATEAEQRARGRRTLFYLEPPAGAVGARIHLPTRASDLGSPLDVTVLATSIDQHRTRLQLEVRNHSTSCVWSRHPGRAPIMMLATFLRSGTSAPVEAARRLPLPLVLAPGEKAKLAVDVALPQAASAYELQIAPVLHGVGFGNPLATTTVRLSSPPRASAGGT